MYSKEEGRNSSHKAAASQPCKVAQDRCDSLGRARGRKKRRGRGSPASRGQQERGARKDSLVRMVNPEGRHGSQQAGGNVTSCLQEAGGWGLEWASGKQGAPCPGTGLRGLLWSPSHHATPLGTDRAPEPAGLAVCKLCSLEEGHPEPGILVWFRALA